ncbi:MAG: protease inhibitor I42 family protein [Acidimicrobiia bacterium]
MTTKRFVALVVVLVLAAGLFVAFTTQPWDSSGNGTSITVYTAGQSVEVDKGDKFVVALESNPTTGYSWQAEDNKLVEQQKSRFVAGDSKLAGAGGTQLITFLATKRGSTTLTLDYARSFEKDTPPAKTEDISVRVR